MKNLHIVVRGPMADPQAEALFREIFPANATPAQKRKLQIIEAAIKSYATHGIENTTYDRIAKICKITRPLIVHYFKDTNEIFDVAVKYIRANFQRLAIEAIKSQTDPRAQLRAYVESTFKWGTDYPHHGTTWKLVYYYCDLDPKLREIQTEMVQTGADRIAALIELGKSQKVFKCKDSKKSAGYIQILLTGALIKAFTENMPTKLDDYAKEISEACLKIALGETL